MSQLSPVPDCVLVKPTALADVSGAARRAQADADAAALASAVEVREMKHAAEHHAAEELLARVWSDPMGSPLPAHVTRTLSLIGGYVAGAYDADGELLGAAAGFLTGATEELGPAHLHSHIAGVAEAARSRHIGFALKLHQRAWALSRGITQVTWTFDPLVARNAYFNLSKLGAKAVAYLADFYGDMTDGINAGQGSDRLLAQWDLCSQRTLLAIHGNHPNQDLADLDLADLDLADLDLAGLDHAGPDLTGPGGHGRLVLRPDARSAPQRLSPARTGPVACGIPADIERMRHDDPQLAVAWRRAVRAVLGGAMQAGYRVAGFARPGYYLLKPGTEYHRPDGGGQEAEE
jgi:predicted GNAT superfamily acetyltransferase